MKPIIQMLHHAFGLLAIGRKVDRCLEQPVRMESAASVNDERRHWYDLFRLEHVGHFFLGRSVAAVRTARAV